uniref:Uncharacterized protein n=1 Tax=Rhizophora mucronata TaxID=61149 RepID=A0A2P2MSL9_RHIMU
MNTLFQQVVSTLTSLRKSIYNYGLELTLGFVTSNTS